MKEWILCQKVDMSNTRRIFLGTNVYRIDFKLAQF